MSDRPSTQLFSITRAPECVPLTRQQLKHALGKERPDSEWEAGEVEVRLMPIIAMPRQMPTPKQQERNMLDGLAMLEGAAPGGEGKNE